MNKCQQGAEKVSTWTVCHAEFISVPKQVREDRETRSERQKCLSIFKNQMQRKICDSAIDLIGYQPIMV
jgi:hypothetical protein